MSGHQFDTQLAKHITYTPQYGMQSRNEIRQIKTDPAKAYTINPLANVHIIIKCGYYPGRSNAIAAVPHCTAFLI